MIVSKSIHQFWNDVKNCIEIRGKWIHQSFAFNYARFHLLKKIKIKTKKHQFSNNVVWCFQLVKSMQEEKIVAQVQSILEACTCPKLSIKPPTSHNMGRGGERETKPLRGLESNGDKKDKMLIHKWNKSYQFILNCQFVVVPNKIYHCINCFL